MTQDQMKKSFETFAANADAKYMLTPSKWRLNGVTTYDYQRTQHAYEGWCAAIEMMKGSQ